MSEGNVPVDPASMPQVEDRKKEIKDYIMLRLGDQIVDVELDKEHLDLAIKQALIKYRQKAANSTEESFIFLDLVKDTSEYILPKEILEVRAIYRRGIGSVTGTTASQFEPFASGYLNTYMLVAGRVGGLVNYELFAAYQKLAMTMFGGYIMFLFNRANKKLTIQRKIPESGEVAILHVYNHRPDQVLLADHQIFPWIQEYAYSFSKLILGQAYAKHGSIIGPQGPTNLNGSELKQEGQQEMQKLEEDLKTYVDGSTPLSFIIG